MYTTVLNFIPIALLVIGAGLFFRGMGEGLNPKLMTVGLGLVTISIVVGFIIDGVL